MSVVVICTDLVPRRTHYWWCRDCDQFGDRVERLDFAFNARQVHLAVCHG